MIEITQCCEWCSRLVRVRGDETYGYRYCDPDGTPHVCGPDRTAVHMLSAATTTRAAAVAQDERSEAG